MESALSGHLDESHFANKWLIYSASIKLAHCCIYHALDRMMQKACFCSKLTTRHEGRWFSEATLFLENLAVLWKVDNLIKVKISGPVAITSKVNILFRRGNAPNAPLLISNGELCKHVFGREIYRDSATRRTEITGKPFATRNALYPLPHRTRTVWQHVNSVLGKLV